MNIIRCKIGLVGEPRVGKTSIISQLVKNNFNNTYQTTLGIEYNTYEIPIQDTNYTVQFHILDFSGFSVFRELIENQIKDVNFVLYVYDSTNLDSFQNIKLWHSQVKDLLVKKSAIGYLVGNKTENKEKIVTDSSSANNMASTLNLKEWSLSARSMNNVKELFENMANLYYQNYTSFLKKASQM